MLARKLFYLKKVLRNQWKKKNDLEEIQRKMMRSIITHSYKYVPFYRRAWKKCGLTPNDIKTVDDLKKLSIIKRSDVEKNYNDFIALTHKQKYELIKKTTSGSSGKPMEITFDYDAWDYLDAVYLRSLLAAGYKPNKPLAYYWYEPFKRMFYNSFGFMNKIYIPHSLSEEEQLEFLQKLNPEYIYYFSSSLYFIAKLMIRNGINLSPKSVIVHAEIATKNMKKVIGDAFDAPVFDHYGTNEFNRLSWECGEHVGYHVDTDSIVMEIINDNETVADGEMGSAVITGLMNYTMPLIRYDIGDIVVPTSELCNCGRGLPLIKSIEGRRSDLIILRGGKIITPRMFIDYICSLGGIDKFQIKYWNKDKFHVSLCCKDIKGMENNISAAIRDLCGKKIKIKTEFTDKLSKSKRGKIKLVERIK